MELCCPNHAKIYFFCEVSQRGERSPARCYVVAGLKDALSWAFISSPVICKISAQDWTEERELTIYHLCIHLVNIGCTEVAAFSSSGDPTPRILHHRFWVPGQFEKACIIWGILHKWNPIVWGGAYVTVFFSLPPWDSPGRCLSYQFIPLVAERCPTGCAWTTVGLTACPLKDIWVVPRFCLFWMNLLVTSVHRCFAEHACSFL